MLSDVMLVGNIHGDSSRVAKCQYVGRTYFLCLPLKGIHCKT